MGARSSGREAALQMLFALDAGESKPARVIRDFWREFPGDPEGREYADAAVLGVMNDLQGLDDLLRRASTNWRLERMARVDRNLLRLAAWELACQADIPAAVVIDEAVTLAKRYGNANSGGFVNGVLSQVAGYCGRSVNVVLEEDPASTPDGERGA